MPDHSRAEYSSAHSSSAEDSSAESRARGEMGGGCETVCGGVRVDMLMTARGERSTSCWYRCRVTRGTGDNRAWRASRAELSKSEDIIRSGRRSWNNWMAGRAVLGDGHSRACCWCDY